MLVAATRVAAVLLPKGLRLSTTLFHRKAVNGYNNVIYRSFSITKLEFPVDGDITVSRVRLLREGKFVGDFDIAEARQKAKEEGLNLILFRPRADPPVCVLAKYQDFIEQQRALRDREANRAANTASNGLVFSFDPSIKVKVVQISSQCAESDFTRKIQGARRFLESGHRVEIVVFQKSSRNNKTVPTTLRIEDIGKVEAGVKKAVALAAKSNVTLSYSLDNPLIQRVDYIYAQLADVGRPYTLRSKVDMNQRQLILKFWPA
ncbi:hypothetical protein BgAZ_203570 [Babesia gibsoni]|uniref:Translation initiation factor 3 N-terminal domain-containing protein n=1 Tax=Babesia gibsoni TaxID=33632 RepID=A0AAD8LQJ8_BABGI|nr:hypothetical protein BgAZ_203570 [Babesia gibsoni]